jgi:tRNA 2-thiouridine synthesizing protein E
MPLRQYANKTVQVSNDGFLLNLDEWSPDIAEEIARDAGISDLTEDHWKVISFCREDMAQTGKSPGLRRISKRSGVNMKSLYKLFPKGPGKLAARISGLPKPKSCI